MPKNGVLISFEGSILDEFTASGAKPRDAGGIACVQASAPRQEECLRLTAFRTDREIAAVLGISEATVKKHVHEACQRLGVNRRKAALALLTPETATPEIVATTPHDPAPQMAADIGRFGYRPPPRNAYARVLMMAGLSLALAVTTTTVTVLVADYHRLLEQHPREFALASPLHRPQALLSR